MSEPVVKCRNFHGVVYPDSESYDCNEVLEKLNDVFVEWAYILHDSDVDENGEVKKAHIHWLGKRKTPVTVKTIANALGLAEHDVERTKSWKKIVRYLIHADNEDKFQYQPEQVVTNFDYGAYVSPLSDVEMAMNIIDHILENGIVRTTELAHWCAVNGLWSEFRRSYPIYAAIMHENMEVTK